MGRSETFTIPLSSPFYPECACMCACGYIFKSLSDSIARITYFFLYIYSLQRNKDTDTVVRSNTEIIKVILTVVFPLCDSANQVERRIAVVRLRAASHCPPPPSLLRVLTLVRGGCAVRRQQRQQQRLHCAPPSSRQDEKPQGGTLRRAAVGGKGRRK